MAVPVHATSNTTVPVEEKIVAIKVDSEGNEIPLTLEEYLKEIEVHNEYSPIVTLPQSQLNNPTITPFAYNFEYYKFVLNGSSSTYYKSPVQISDPIQCPTDVPSGCPIAKDWTVTTNRSFSSK